MNWSASLVALGLLCLGAVAWPWSLVIAGLGLGVYAVVKRKP